jgi:hypothetical protein
LIALLLLAALAAALLAAVGLVGIEQRILSASQQQQITQ